MHMLWILIIFLFLFALGLFFFWRGFCKRAFTLFGLPEKPRKVLLWVLPLLGGLAILTAYWAVGIVYLHFFFFCALCAIAARFLRGTKAERVLLTALPALALTLLVTVYAYANMCAVRETDYTVTTEKPLTKSYTLVLVTDTHYGTSLNAERLGSLCAEMEALSPDALLLGGDLVDESTSKADIKEIFSLFDGVKTTYGTYYVSGNHDGGAYRKGIVNDVAAALEGTDITFLQDEGVLLGDELLLIGRRDCSDSARKPLSELLLNKDSARFTVILDHQPRQYAENAAMGADLTLSGHTHAGQLFPINFITTLFDSELNYGRIEKDGMTAIVSSGASGWGYPLRTFAHSEFVVITVTPKA